MVEKNKKRKRGSKAKPRVKREEKTAPSGELIDMQEAIKLLKTSRPTFYRWLRSGKIEGMKIGRQWRFYRSEIDRFLRGDAPRIDLPADIEPLIKDLIKLAKELGLKGDIPGAVHPVDEAIRLMIHIGIKLRASDIHLSSYLTDTNSEPRTTLRYRIDGVLKEFVIINPRLLPPIIEVWKRMASLDPKEKAMPQDGRILIKLSELDGSDSDKTYDLRTQFLLTGLGEALTVRILDPSIVSLKLKRLDYNPRDLDRLLSAIRSPWGVTILSGPTGSGKTTTMYCCLNEISTPRLKVMSVEVPIEYYLPYVTQIAVDEKGGVTFERAFKAVFRSDPDVIMIGEVRSPETMQMAHQAALTGHLVLTQMHSPDAVRTLKRLVDLGSDPFIIKDSTKLIFAQRLVRKLCPECSVKFKPGKQILDEAAQAAHAGGLDWDSLKRNFKKAVGCENCARTGYKGRTVTSEALEITSEIIDALKNDAPIKELRKIAISQGMTTIAADGVRRFTNGETSWEEIKRVCIPADAG